MYRRQWISTLNDGLNLFIPVNIAIMKLSSQQYQYGNIQTTKSLNVATHFKKINSAGTHLRQPSKIAIFRPKWMDRVICVFKNRNLRNHLPGVVGFGSLAATFSDTAKNQNHQGALIAAFLEYKFSFCIQSCYFGCFFGDEFWRFHLNTKSQLHVSSISCWRRQWDVDSMGWWYSDCQ